MSRCAFALMMVSASADWCGGVPPPQLASDSNVDVYFAQAPLFSTGGQWWSGLTRNFNLFHTAVVFHDVVDDQFWTLEFDMVRPNNFIPSVNWNGTQGSEINWVRNEARWCLWPGIYNGRKHWKTFFTKVATLQAPQLSQLMTDFVAPLNKSLSEAHAYPTYNSFYVTTPGGDEIVDITCGTGVAWVVDYIKDTLNVSVSKFDGSVTRVKVNASGLEEVASSDTDAWCEMVNYFDLQDKAVNGDFTKGERFSMIDRMLPQKYVFDGNRNKYFKILGDDHYFEVVKEELFGLPPKPDFACDENCEPPAGPAVFCSSTTTTTQGPLPPSDQKCHEPGHCGRIYQTCCVGFRFTDYKCECHLQNAGTGFDGEGGRAGGNCGDCGLAFAECCTAYGIKGFKCGCDAEPSGSFLDFAV